MTGLWVAAVRRNLYDNGNIDDGIFPSNGTQGLNNHIWWEKIDGGPILRPLPRQWHQPCGLGGRELNDTMTSNFTRSWI